MRLEVLRGDGLTAVAACMIWLFTRGGWLQKVVAFKASKTNVNHSKRHVVTPGYTDVLWAHHTCEASGGP